MDRLEPAGSAYPAPELDVAQWLGGEQTLAGLRGRVVMIEAFQMLCAGCLSYGLPQAQRVQRLLPEVTVLGLHTVFEHHEVTGPAALAVFVRELGIAFPVGVDRHEVAGGMPVTMRAYDLQGTPSTILIDRAGNLRFTHLGAIPELQLGTMLGELLAEPAL
jgi:hypothetical protein